MSAMSLLRVARCGAYQSSLLRPTSNALVAFGQSASATTSQDDYFVKNEKLKRPLSPWHIYKFQVTSMLSITHRGTGLGLGVLLYGWGISSLPYFSANTNWSQSLDAISATVPASLLLLVKVAAAWGVGYHTLNGVRHLSWDLGKGFSLKQLYTSGYAVLALSILFALYAAANS